MPEARKFRACLFDMDGLLINTEDMYTVATNEFLARHGKGPLPWSVKIQLQGRPGTESARLLLEWAQIDITPEQLFAETSAIQERLWPETAFLPGAAELLAALDRHDVPFALATSSLHEKYGLKTAHLRGHFDLFRHHVVTGDDARIPAGRGKPAPDIWLVALESLNRERRAQGLDEIAPEETIVFEDGIPGVEGAQKAGCFVVWVPHEEAAELLGDAKMAEIVAGGPSVRLRSLAEFDGHAFGLW